VDSGDWQTAIDALWLGLGMGMVMQVLLIAVQNSVDYERLGVATSGTMLFRSLGGALGVALFGAIFANRLHAQLAGPGMEFLASVIPSAVRGLPPNLHEEYITAVMLALRPVFLAAAAISALGFALTWMLREYPLREGAPAEGMGESFAMPRDARAESPSKSKMASLNLRRSAQPCAIAWSRRGARVFPIRSRAGGRNSIPTCSP